MFGLKLLVDVVRRAGVFKRNRTPLETKSEAKMPTRRIPTQLNPQNHNQIHKLMHNNLQLPTETQLNVTLSLK
jgi:hypothetical protein